MESTINATGVRFAKTVEHRAQIRFGIDQQRRWKFCGQDTVGAQFDLRSRFFAANVDDFAVTRELRGELQEQGRLAGARRSTNERDASRNRTAAQHGVELRHVEKQTLVAGRTDLVQRRGRERRGGWGALFASGFGRDAHRLLVERVPSRALRAPPQPAR